MSYAQYEWGGSERAEDRNNKGKYRMSEAINTMEDGTCRPIKAQYYKNSCANFLRQTCYGATGGITKRMNNNQEEYAIRKLTPMECWRLMGFSDEDFLSAKTGSRDTAIKLLDKYPRGGADMMDEADQLKKISNTQLYKQAGNSIVVDVLYHIYQELYKAMPYLFEDLKVGSYFSGIGAFEKGLDKLYAGIN